MSRQRATLGQKVARRPSACSAIDPQHVGTGWTLGLALERLQIKSFGRLDGYGTCMLILG
jgi:hypothetical protein